MDVLTLLIIGHLFGTILGVGGATFIEINLNKSLADGQIDPVESSFLHTTYTVTRIGLFISLVTGLGFLVLYRFEGQMFRYYDPVLWAKFFIIGVIIVNSLLLQARVMPLWLGSSLSLVSWYAAFVAGTLVRGPKISFWAIIAVYALAVLIGAFVLEGLRKRFGVKTP